LRETDGGNAETAPAGLPHPPVAPPCPDGSLPPVRHQRPGESAFPEWTATVTNPRLCAAIAGQLTFDARIISTGSGRLRTARARHQSARTG
jgi:hypothetical protein